MIRKWVGSRLSPAYPQKRLCGYDLFMFTCAGLLYLSGVMQLRFIKGYWTSLSRPWTKRMHYFHYQSLVKRCALHTSQRLLVCGLGWPFIPLYLGYMLAYLNFLSISLSQHSLVMEYYIWLWSILMYSPVVSRALENCLHLLACLDTPNYHILVFGAKYWQPLGSIWGGEILRHKKYDQILSLGRLIYRVVYLKLYCPVSPWMGGRHSGLLT
jgi:hypothetical protein